MNLPTAVAVLTSVLAALGFYLSSPRCLWTSVRPKRKLALIAASVLAMLSAGVWMSAFGIAVGLCAMLGTSMLCLVVLPWIALFTGAANAAERE